jgi:hypothetical protein
MKTRTATEKKLVDNAWLVRAWRRWHRERVEALLIGPYAASVQALLAFLKTMPSASALVEFVKHGPWQNTDAELRAEVLSLIDTVIIARREKLGLPPFDDSIGDMPLNVFLLVREQLTDIRNFRLTAAPPGA